MSSFKEETMYSLLYQYGPLIVLSTFYIMFMKLSLFEKKSEPKKPLHDSSSTITTTTTLTTNPHCNRIPNSHPHPLHSHEIPPRRPLFDHNLNPNPNPNHNEHEHDHNFRQIVHQYTICHYLHRTALLVLRAFLRCTPSITLPLPSKSVPPSSPSPSPSLSHSQSQSLSNEEEVECSPTPNIKQMCDTIEYKLKLATSNSHHPHHRRSDSTFSSTSSISQFRIEALPQIKAACDELTALRPLPFTTLNEIYYDKLEFEDENEYDSDSLDDHIQMEMDDDHEMS